MIPRHARRSVGHGERRELDDRALPLAGPRHDGTRTATRIAGTFHFTAEASVGTTPPTTSVTDGAFDITVAAGLPPLPTGVGSTAGATLGTTPWNAATIAGINGGAGSFSLNAFTNEYSITFVTKVPVSAGNTYGIPSQMDMQVAHFGTADSWSGGTGADVGSVTITTFDANRLIATFGATLPPAGTGSALEVTGGHLNAYLP
jgi:hypothetical protein